MRARIPTHLTDSQLVDEVKRCARCERDATAHLIAHLAEMDARQLHLGAGCSSLFAYCCEVLRLSEHETYNRIEAARAARRFPIILDQLGDGSLNLTTVRLLAPHLTGANHQELLAEAAGRSKREVEELVARRFPRPDVAASIRKLPVARSSAMPVAAVVSVANEASVSAREVSAAGVASSLSVASLPPAPVLSTGPAAPPLTDAPTRAASPARPIVTPLASDRYQIRFTASAETLEKLRLAQDLLRHAVPTGDPAEIVDRALTLLIEDLARKKCAAVKTPSRRGRPTAAGSRHVPANLRRVVWARDKGRCAFVTASGRRCKETAFLEFHHVEPYAVGGQATVDNIQLRCRAHNGYEALLFYGSNGLRREGVVRESAPRYGLSLRDATRSGPSSTQPSHGSTPGTERVSRRAPG